LKLTCRSTSPAIWNFGANLLSETIGTFVLVTVVAAIFSKKVALLGPAAALCPFLVGVLVWAIGLSLDGTTGYAINPARDLGPRITHSLLPLGKKAARAGTMQWFRLWVRSLELPWQGSSFVSSTLVILHGDVEDPIRVDHLPLNIGMRADSHPLNEELPELAPARA
jgi:hypothetical protein